MSFMFNPYPFDDTNCVNEPKLSDNTVASIKAGAKAGALELLRCVEDYFSGSAPSSTCIIGMDGYITADWNPVINLLSQELRSRDYQFAARPIAAFYKSTEAIDDMLRSCLPEDRSVDPVLLFGKLFHGGYAHLFDANRLSELEKDLHPQYQGVGESKKVLVVYGCGTTIEVLRPYYHLTTFFDVTPKEVVLRLKAGDSHNLGDAYARPFKELMRRCYYFDFILAGQLRGELLRADAIDYYVASDDRHKPLFVPRNAFNEICSSLVRYPLRSKPVYNEGVWGGHFMSRIRNLPGSMRNCAWVFDLIPLEVSLLIKAGDYHLDIPFFTFVQKEGEALMGRDCMEKYNGFFPIRLNYDDTWHSGGNMSIQVHPTREYAVEHFNELGGQDESYYIVASGHEAKTYIGFKEDASAEAFFNEVKASEQTGSEVKYDDYVHAVETRPGTQVLLPSGTIHASGRNQVVLEIGSLTVGSYTFKLYDYLRKDLDGTPRPIHSKQGIKVLKTERKTQWVETELIPQPRLLCEGKGWKEHIIGEHELIYFSLRRLEFDHEFEGDTEGFFHVLTLIDGETVRISSVDDPDKFFIQHYLDIVVIPASMGPYRIQNLGNAPVCLHKVQLRNDFMDF